MDPFDHHFYFKSPFHEGLQDSSTESSDNSLRQAPETQERKFRLPLWPVFFFAVLVSVGLNYSKPAPHVETEALSETQSVKPGTRTWLGIHFKLEKGWHLYWQNPGDSGDAPRIHWNAPPGVEIGSVEWPAPERISVGPLMNYGYKNSLLLMVPVMVPLDVPPSLKGQSAKLEAEVKWLVCKDTCIPGKAKHSLELPVSPLDPKPASQAKLFQQTRLQFAKPPLPSWTLLAESPYQVSEDSIFLSIESKSPLKGKASFFPSQSHLIENAAEQKVERSEHSIRIHIKKSDQIAQMPSYLDGILKLGENAYQIYIPISHPAQPLKMSFDSKPSEGSFFLTLLEAVLMAFLGGLILNLMPCVFPVLFVKALNWVEQAKETDRRTIYLHSFFYTLGILVSFWALAAVIFGVKSGGESLGWGFQLQSPTFVTLLSSLLLLMAMNLVGAFEIGTTFMGIGNRLTARKGYAGSFFTGTLATVVATPCTAPFMGTALAFALSEPLPVAIGVFTSLGLGLATPYCILSMMPSLGKLLPRPGRWMESFKQMMAFPVLGTVIWLTWVLGLQTDMNRVALALCGYLILAMAGWTYGRWQKPATRGVALILGGLAVWIQFSGSAPLPNSTASKIEGGKHQSGLWQDYSRAKLSELRKSGNPVLVDFTAAWCVTCKVNEMVAFTTPVMRELASRGIVPMRADWTNANPEISASLEEFGRNGVPLYVLYPASPDAAPVLLPQILTPQIILNAVKNMEVRK